MKIGSCDSTTFYYVTIFDVELESDFSFKNLNFISSNNFGNKLEDSKKMSNNNINFSYVGYSKPRPLQKELQNNSPTFSSLGRIHRWSMSQDKGQIQSSSSQINIDGFEKVLPYFEYIKLGPYKQECGGLDNPNTNQKLFGIVNVDGFYRMVDITYKFWKTKQ